MHRVLIATLLAGLALLAPLASAQQNSALTLMLRPLDHALDGDTTTATGAVVTYVADATVLLNTAGVPVTYQVSKQPAWASVIVSPSSDIFMPNPQPSVSYAMTKAFTLSISVAKDAPHDALDSIEITAIVMPGMVAAKGAMAKAMIAVHVVNTQVPCEATPAAGATALAPPTTTSESTPTDAQTVHVQSTAPTSVPTSAMAIGGFAAVGAGAGFLLRRKL
ncbi:MAG: hypothetical protein WDA16_12795 [Candidatus Thermoplasmatota archaeon]